MLNQVTFQNLRDLRNAVNVSILWVIFLCKYSLHLSMKCKRSFLTFMIYYFLNCGKTWKNTFVMKSSKGFNFTMICCIIFLYWRYFVFFHFKNISILNKFSCVLQIISMNISILYTKLLLQFSVLEFTFWSRM